MLYSPRRSNCISFFHFKPLLFTDRESDPFICYYGPCGKKLPDYESLHAYLCKTDCALTVRNFCYDGVVDCLDTFIPTRVIYEVEVIFTYMIKMDNFRRFMQIFPDHFLHPICNGYV